MRKRLIILLIVLGVAFGQRFRFLYPTDGMELKGNVTSFTVRGMGGDSLRLVVEGGQIYGGKLRPDQKADFIGVRVPAGRIPIILEVLTPKGWLKGDSISVVAPGNVSEIRLSLPEGDIYADGISDIRLDVELLDAFGRHLYSTMPITIEADRATVVGSDMDFSSPGWQGRIAGGKGSFTLRPGNDAGQITVRVSSGMAESEINHLLKSHLRPMIMVGHIGGEMGWQKVENEPPDVTGTYFEEEGFHYDGRGAFFARGALFQRYLLTASYDSKVIRRPTMFRQTDPEELLPIYGDTGSLFYMNRSTTPLYLRLEKDASFIELGDFQTNLDEDAEYALYNRTLTGVHTELMGKKADLKLFFSPYIEGFGQLPHIGVTDTLMPDGTSGFYQLSNINIVRNSERIRIETRDRYQPDLIIETDYLQRFEDYEIDYNEGMILFTSSVQSFDAWRNTRVIVVDYEIDGDVESASSMGGRLVVHPGEVFEIAATGIRQQVDDDVFSLVGGDFDIHKGERLKVRGEFTNSSLQDSAGTTSGYAASLTARYETERLGMEAYYNHRQEGFTNTSVVTDAATADRMGGQIAYTFGDLRTRLSGFFQSTHDKTNFGRSLLEAAYKLDDFTFSVGGEYNFADNGEALGNTHALLRVDWQALRKLSFNVRRDQSIAGDDLRPSETALGLEWNAWRSNILYGAVGLLEYPDDMRQFASVGIKSKAAGITTKGEYRVNSAGDDWSSKALIGLSDRIMLARWAYLDLGFENEVATDGESPDDRLAASMGISLKPEAWLITTKGEFAQTRDSEMKILGAVGVSTNLWESFSLLLKNEFDLRDEGNDLSVEDADYIRNRALLGLAIRPVNHDYFNGLLKFEHRWDQNLGQSPKLREMRMIYSFQSALALGRLFELTSRYAGKHVIQQLEIMDENTGWIETDPVSAYTDVKQVGIRFDISRRFDIGIEGRWFTQYETYEHMVDAAPELGIVIFRNVRLGLGYNMYGYSDNDLSDGTYWRYGPYFTLDLKLSERGLGIPVIDYDPEMEIDHSTIMELDDQDGVIEEPLVPEPELVPETPAPVERIVNEPEAVTKPSEPVADTTDTLDAEPKEQSAVPETVNGVPPRKNVFTLHPEDTIGMGEAMERDVESSPPPGNQDDVEADSPVFPGERGDAQPPGEPEYDTPPTGGP